MSEIVGEKEDGIQDGRVNGPADVSGKDEQVIATCVVDAVEGAIEGGETSHRRLYGFLFDPQKRPSDLSLPALACLDRVGCDMAFSEAVLAFDQTVDGGEEFYGSTFFEHEPSQRRFIEKLQEFTVMIEKKIDSLMRHVRENSSWAKFMDEESARNTLRKACFAAFFYHYGEKRKGEKGDDEMPLDYVYHSIEAAFDCLGEQMFFLDERTIVALIFHDTHEDYHKGLLALLCSDEHEMDEVSAGLGFDHGKSRDYMELKKEWILSRLKKFENDLDVECPPRKKGELGVSELVELLTKPSDDRNESFLYFMEMVSAYDDPQIFEAIKAFRAKWGGDRVSNIRTNRVGGMGRKSTADVIEDETVYGPLELCGTLNAVLLAHFLKDYIHESDPDRRIARKKRTQTAFREEANAMELRRKTLIEQFEHDFRIYMQDRFSSSGYRSLGIRRSDYRVVFIPIGLSAYPDDVEAAELGRGDVSTGVQHYVAIFPTTDDEKKKKAVTKEARRFMGEMFDENRIDFTGREKVRDCLLGQKILEGKEKGEAGFGYHESTSGHTYGDSIWHVYSDREEMEDALLGAIHVVTFHKGEHVQEAKKRILDMVEGLRRDVKWARDRYVSAKNFASTLDVLEVPDFKKLLSFYATSVCTKRDYPVKVRIEDEKGVVTESVVYTQKEDDPLLAAFYVRPEIVFAGIGMFSYKELDGTRMVRIKMHEKVDTSAESEAKKRIRHLLDIFEAHRAELLSDDLARFQ